MVVVVVVYDLEGKVVIIDHVIKTLNGNKK